MGCNSSKDSGLAHVDDSVHVMIKHDKKRAKQRGEEPHGYVPRAPHPLLDQAKQQQPPGGDDKGETKQDESTPKPVTATEE